MDRVLEAIRHRWRREALGLLRDHGALPLADIADCVAERELGQPLDRATADEVLQVYLALYHAHVPKLVATGLVAYDQNLDEVTLTCRRDSATGQLLDRLLGRRGGGRAA